MFRTATVFHVKSIVPKSKVNELILKLHETGVSQVKKAKEESGMDETREEALSEREITEAQLRLNSLLAQLEKYREIIPPEGLLKQMFFPGPPQKHRVNLLSNEKILEEVHENLAKIEPAVQAKLAKLEQAKQDAENNSYLTSSLEAFPREQTRLFKSTENLSISTGTILTSETDKALHEVGFESITVPFEKNAPQAIITRLRNENNSLRKEILETEASLKELAKKHSGTLDMLEEEIGVAKERVEAFSMLHNSGSVSVIEAWVPEENFEKMKGILTDTCGGHYTEVKERDDAPTILENHKIVKPFEIITGLYSVPKYKGIDPTPIIAVSFPLFFGFMLTDFAYGVALAIIAILLYRGMGKYNEGLRQFSALLIISGIATAILGAMFTSYFGDIFQRLGIQPPGLLDPLAQVLEIIILALVIAAAHMFIGLLVGYYDNLKKGKVRDALGLQGVWIFFLVGVVFMLLDGGLFGTIGMGLIGLAILTQLVYNYLENGPVISILSLFNFSGFIGDTFSYVRLTALAIGTAGIALAVNFMALMVNDMVPVVGFILGAIVFIAGHLFNMVMNGLGAFIHTLRLHFLEFFSEFYSGGGTHYKPFVAYRKRNKTEVV